MLALNFIAMFVLMYAMVDSYANVYPNLNQVYMAALMTAPMLVLEVLLMRGMYGANKLNALLIVLGAVALIASFLFIRWQTGIGDRQFLESMIPHHASALLMCEQAHLTDPDIQKLCRNILAGQQSEIDFMKAKLGAM